MSRLGAAAGVGLLLAGAPTLFAGDCVRDCVFEEDFDSYVAGTRVVDYDEWTSWEDNPAYADAFITSDESNSGLLSLEIDGSDDIVHEFTGIDSGRWALSAHVFVPGTFSGKQYFILLNTYEVGGHNWSTQVEFDGGTHLVRDIDGAHSLPLETDEWVELEVIIDLNHDTQTVTYGGQFLFTDSWTNHAGGGGGALSLGAIDLFNFGGTLIYWDDIMLCPTCIADVDGSGAVAIGDLVMLLGTWGAPGGSTDFDCTGLVDIRDLLFLLGHWGPCPG